MALRATNPNSSGVKRVEIFPVTSIVSVHGEATLQKFDEPAIVEAIDSIVDAMPEEIVLSPSGGDDAAIINQAAAEGLPIYANPGIWKFETPIKLINNFSFKMAPGSKIEVNIPGNTVNDSAFVAEVPAQVAASATTLASTPAAGSNQVHVTNSAPYANAQGKYVQITNADGIGQYYLVDHAAGNLLTLSRDCSIWGFQAGDAIVLLKTEPPTWFVDLGNAQVSGTFVLFLYAPASRQPTFQNVWANGNDLVGASFDAFAGFHTGTFNGLLQNIFVDLFGAPGLVNTGCGFVGVERCTAFKVITTNGATAVAWKTDDSRYADAIDCSGTNCIDGAAFGSDFGVSVDANVGCRIVGGDWSGNSQRGLVGSGSRDCLIDVDGANDNGLYGVLVNRCVNMELRKATARRNVGGQVVIDNTSTGTSIGVLVLESLTTGANAPDLLIESDCTIGDVSLKSKGPCGTGYLQVTCASIDVHVEISKLRMTCQPAVGNYAVRCDGGTLTVDDADVQLGTTGMVAASAQAAIAKVKLHAFCARPTGGAASTFGYYAHIGAMEVDQQCDVEALATNALIDGGGSLIAQLTHTGTPEGALVASPGSTCANRSGGAGTSFYVKEANVTNLGWVGK